MGHGNCLARVNTLMSFIRTDVFSFRACVVSGSIHLSSAVKVAPSLRPSFSCRPLREPEWDLGTPPVRASVAPPLGSDPSVTDQKSNVADPGAQVLGLSQI